MTPSEDLNFSDKWRLKARRPRATLHHGPLRSGFNAFLLLLLTLAAALVLARGGSNLGSYATHFSPATLTGQVTSGGSPVAGARVSTTAGHFTTTDVNGDYTLYLDAPGIYTVTAKNGLETSTQPVEVFLGTTSNLDLATLCGDLELSNQTIITTELVEACDTLSVGPNLTVSPTGDLTLRSGGTVILKNGFSVQSGGKLTVELSSN
ncbi:MAG: carboxypeptidase-like regulatory domain-containing protein [Anaerolineae bacterium]